MSRILRDIYAVMGNPIAHSKSPLIHSAFAQQTGEAVNYIAIEVEVGRFAEAVTQFRQTPKRGRGPRRGKGLNITVPFKQDAFLIAEHKTSRAELAGAVNTLWFDDDAGIFGDTTDGVGLVQDILVNHQRPIADQSVLILGAGGAVRGILEPLFNEHPKQVIIANRTLSKAEDLVCRFSDFQGLQAVSFDQLKQRFDLIINGTSASLRGDVPPLPEHIFKPGGWCYDMMYGNEPTAFMRWAQAHGADYTADGLGMLVEQAAESFYIWRGKRPETSPVIQALRDGTLY